MKANTLKGPLGFVSQPVQQWSVRGTLDTININFAVELNNANQSDIVINALEPNIRTILNGMGISTRDDADGIPIRPAQPRLKRPKRPNSMSMAFLAFSGVLFRDVCSHLAQRAALIAFMYPF
jgi:hypothetical protein